MAEKDRMAIALAITGFTILSPEERARGIVRQSIFDDIEEHIAVGDYYRARAGIRFALRYLEDGNIFSFSENDRELLQDRLTQVEREIEKLERARPGSTENTSHEKEMPSHDAQ
jgi:Arc/MetJ-type ribon-helix-helix transcriptional regulator